MSNKNLRLIKTLWGIDEPISASLFVDIRNEGYHGVEVIRLAYLFDRNNLVNSLNEAGLSLVCQIHTSGGYLNNGEYIYCGSDSVEDHKQDFRRQILEAKDLLSQVDMGGFINVHAGVDAWTLDESVDFLSFALDEIEELRKSEEDLLVTIETHRQRLFGSPFQTRELLSKLHSIEKIQSLKLNADLSHWYCACERVFDKEKEPDKKWWPGLLKSVADRCHYIHARFGWAQGPQMADPSAKECEVDREVQLETWKTLIMKQLDRDDDRDVYCCPEYGPSPYLATLPHTQEPVASLTKAVKYTKNSLEKLYSEL